MPRVSFLLALLCLPFVVGCEGCRRSGDDAEDKNQEKAPLEDFSSRSPLAFPADANPLTGGIKPGHWMTASQSLKSNKIDARGELLSRASASGSSIQTGQEQTSEGEIQTVRPVVLPKGQFRRFDYRILTPVPLSNDQRRNFLSSRFVSTGRAVFFETGRQPFNVLSGEEFFFVILTTRPERFAKFQVSDWVRPFRDEDVVFRGAAANYRIVFPPTEDLLPLAETMLDWTSTAIVLWDDLSPDALTPQQQTAFADWVRFGGQLIVNGAPAADAIARTTLADLLPLKPTGNIELDPDAATQLLNGWAVATDRSTEKQVALLQSQSGRVAVDGVAAADAETFPNTGNLVLWRRIGGGRVVQPRFDVTSDWLLNWKSYDSFVNSMLLGRPRRQLIESPDANELSLIRQFYPDLKSPVSDPAFNSRFRITARDSVLPTGVNGGDATSAFSSRYDPLTYVDSSTGIGGWTDDSDTLSLCQQILRNESGIEIPKSSLVIRTLGYYLLILVPVNYLVFRLMGRLEYAWLAVPVIAIGGAIWVARAARLDIGFARSQTEIAFLELQPDYPRGHLTRVVAIYNSLSSSYDVQFDTIDGAASPIWGGNSSPSGSGAVFRTGFAEGPMLSGLAVGSNQVRMLHAEQIMDVGGPIVLDGEGKLINQTAYELFDALVIEKSNSGEVRFAIVGGCESGAAAKLRYRDVAPRVTDELPMQTATLVGRLSSPSAMPNGSTRLVARIDASLPGMTITPDAKQTLSQTIVLAHLKHAPLPAPKADVNLIGDLRRVLGDDEDGDDEDEDGGSQAQDNS
jgi:hypothetical protein